MHKFEVLDPMRRTESFKMATKGVEIHGIPCSVVPLVVLLNVLPMMVAIYMEPDACIVLAGDRCPVYV